VVISETDILRFYPEAARSEVIFRAAVLDSAFDVVLSEMRLRFWNQPSVNIEWRNAQTEAVVVRLIANLLELVLWLIRPKRREFDFNAFASNDNICF